MLSEDKYHCPMCHSVLHIPVGTKVRTTLEARGGGTQMRVITVRGEGEVHRCEWAVGAKKQ